MSRCLILNGLASVPWKTVAVLCSPRSEVVITRRPPTSHARSWKSTSCLSLFHEDHVKLCQPLVGPLHADLADNIYSLRPPAVWNALPWILGSEIWPAASPLQSSIATPTACGIAKVQLMQLDNKSVDHRNISIWNQDCVLLCWCWGYTHVLHSSCIIMRRTILTVFSLNDVFQKQKGLVVERRKTTVGKRRCVKYQMVFRCFAFQMGNSFLTLAISRSLMLVLFTVRMSVGEAWRQSGQETQVLLSCLMFHFAF